ncbi:MAG: DNA double-strand break repair nuclease NurA [Aggregatilineales bacterium]
MTLEFNQIVEQVYRMGAMLDKLDFDVTESVSLAAARFAALDDVAAVKERIEWVRQSDISGYRGAATLDTPDVVSEPINLIVPEPSLPAEATIIAADGSQIYPDELAAVHYYLINLGIFIYHHGSNATPEQITLPDLRFHKAHVHDRYGQIIRNRTVDDRRTAAEMKALAHEVWLQRHGVRPLIALYDNRLLFLPGNDAGDGSDLMGIYQSAMVQLHDADALLAGYIDNPFRAKRVIQLLFLMSLKDENEVRERQRELSQGGDMDGLRDQIFFYQMLKPGERSALMVQNSPQNKEFRDRGYNYEIAFFYLKVYNEARSKVIRVDLPIWVARDPEKVNALHALLLHQCKLQGRNPYPYAITRADELAYVGGKDRSKLQELINVQVRRVRKELVGSTLTAKSRGKEIARSEKRYHDVWGQGIIDDQ